MLKTSHKIGITIVCVILVSIVTGLGIIAVGRYTQYGYGTKQSWMLSEKEQVFVDEYKDTGETWSIGRYVYNRRVLSPQLCVLREQYCSRIGQEYANCDCRFERGDIQQYIDMDEGVFFWERVDFWPRDIEPRTQQLVSDVQASFSRRDCVISYGVIDDQRIDVAREYTFEWGGSARVPVYSFPYTPQLSDEAVASGYTQYNKLIAPHIPYAGSPRGMIVSNISGGPLPSYCVREFERIVDSATIVAYPDAYITEESVGEFFLQSYEENGVYDAGLRLLFMNTNTGREELVQDLDPLYPYTVPVYADGILYYMVGDVGDDEVRYIQTFNIQTQERGTQPFEASVGEVLHDISIFNGNLLYVVGEWCDVYMSPCRNMTLHSRSLQTGKDIVVATGFSSREIIGVVENGDVLLALKDEDGECLWGTYELVDVDTGNIRMLGERSYCGGQPTESDDGIVIPAVHAQLFPGIMYQQGIFTPGGKDGFTPRRYIRAQDRFF